MSYTAALIGYTGFVGSTLLKQSNYSFTHLYNSQNIEGIRGYNFDLVVCAGAPAQKWLANKEPVKDTVGIARLLQCLSQVEAKNFVLISTVDVYKNPSEVYESNKIVLDGLHAYGLNRYILETFVAGRFGERSHIVRLPGLVGANLRKNIIYDLKHDNNVNAINGSNVYQFYPMKNLWRDINIAQEVGLVNLSTEPISAGEVAAVFNREVIHYPKTAHYDMRSVAAMPYAARKDYWYSKQEVIEAIAEYKNS